MGAPGMQLSLCKTEAGIILYKTKSGMGWFALRINAHKVLPGAFKFTDGLVYFNKVYA